MPRYEKASCSRCRQRVWQVAPARQSTDGTEPSSQHPPAAAAAVVCRRCLADPDFCPPGETCAVCLEVPSRPIRYADVHTHSWANQGRCLHRNCWECMRGYLKSRIADGVWNVRCPQEGCPYRLLEHDFKKILNEEGDRPALEQYRSLRSVDFRANLKNVLSAIAERKEGEQVEASAGLLEVGEAAAAAADPAFESWAVQQCQACPVCFVLVRKDVGCNHLACKCGTEFCFGCGAPGSGHPGLPGCLCSQGVPTRLGHWLRSCGRLEPAAP